MHGHTNSMIAVDPLTLRRRMSSWSGANPLSAEGTETGESVHTYIRAEFSNDTQLLPETLKSRSVCVGARPNDQTTSESPRTLTLGSFSQGCFGVLRDNGAYSRSQGRRRRRRRHLIPAAPNRTRTLILTG